MSEMNAGTRCPQCRRREWNYAFNICRHCRYIWGTQRGEKR